MNVGVDLCVETERAVTNQYFVVRKKKVMYSRFREVLCRSFFVVGPSVVAVGWSAMFAVLGVV